MWGPVLEGRDEDAEARGATELAGVAPPARILDVPCGFGRVTRPLAQLGFSVVGLDLSADMVTEARRRCRGLDVEIVQGDLRDLPVAGSFDAALCLFSSIGYSGDPDDDLRFFSAVRARLQEGGAFVIETNHRDHRAAHPIGRTWFEVDGAPVLTEGSMDWVSGIYGEIVRWYEGGDWHERRVEVYQHSATDLDRLLSRAGFTDRQFYGDLDGSPLTPVTRLVAVAR